MKNMDFRQKAGDSQDDTELKGQLFDISTPNSNVAGTSLLTAVTVSQNTTETVPVARVYSVFQNVQSQLSNILVVMVLSL